MIAFDNPRDQLRQVVARIELLSQVSAASLDHASKTAEEDIGGRRPSGGIDRADDREPDFALRSADYFRRRALRCHSDRAVFELLKEAEDTLAAWTRTPLSDAEVVERKSFRWRCEIADQGGDDLSKAERAAICAKYDISNATLYRYRLRYRGLRSTSVRPV